MEEYAKKYRQMVKGYDDGTIKIYSEDEENRVLTKEGASGISVGTFFREYHKSRSSIPEPVFKGKYIE